MPNVKNKLANVRHPNSRKVLAFTKDIKKKANREKAKLGQVLKQNVIGEKMLWFQNHLLPDIICYSPDQTEEIVNEYLARFDEELEQILMKHSMGQRKNRQHASREDIINMTLKREREEFNTCGLEMPDLLNVKQLEMLRSWNGELRYIENFKLRRVAKKHLEQERTRQKKLAEAPPVVQTKKLGVKNAGTSASVPETEPVQDSAMDAE